MKKYYLMFTILITLTFLSTLLFAQEEIEDTVKYSNIIPNHTEMRSIHSDIVNDDYYLYIKLPKDYNETDERYPVIYLLDGDIAFTMAWSTVRYLQYGKQVPDVIIVGIGYGSLLSSDEENMRDRDYTISKLPGSDISGGADNFLKSLKSEMIPFIDSLYRTKPKERILNGYSLGGLITLYALLTKGELFNGYIAGSPYLSLDKDLLQKLMSIPSGKLKNSKAKLFISYGELEDKELYADPINEFIKNLSKNGFNKSQVHKRVFKAGTHFTCPSEAMVYGLKYLFE